MTHRFSIKEIAGQAGLGTATVDRVLNGRANVSPQARARVAAAISELEGQEAQLSARGRRLFFDLVVEAPERFTSEIRHAAEAVLPTIGHAAIRLRYTFRQVATQAETEVALARIAKRGSHGVCLKARDLPRVRAAVDRLTRAGIPVVTAFTDLPATSRAAYCGPDNRAAGQVAAYMMDRFLPAGEARAGGTVLTTLSRTDFHGERERRQGFRALMGRLRPELRLLEVSGGSGLGLETAAQVREAAADAGCLVGVYSMGGANQAVLRTLAALGHRPRAYIAHDLDRENLSLLRGGALTIVLQHDIAGDMRNAILILLRENGLLPGAAPATLSRLNVITPIGVEADLAALGAGREGA